MLIATSTLKPNSLARKTGAPQKATVSEVETAGQDRYDPSPVAVESKPRVYREKAMGAGKLGGPLGLSQGLARLWPSRLPPFRSSAWLVPSLHWEPGRSF
jgi:hypothetical protein